MSSKTTDNCAFILASGSTLEIQGYQIKEDLELVKNKKIKVYRGF